MANFIQSEIKLIHTTEGVDPTSVEKATKPQSNNAGKLNKDGKGSDGAEASKKALLKRTAKFSMLRRSANLALTSLEFGLQHAMTRRQNEAMLAGDMRKTSHYSNQKQRVSGTLATVRQLTMSVIVSAATQNYLLLGFQVAQSGIERLIGIANVAEQELMRQERDMRDIMLSRTKRERLVHNVFRR